MDIPDPISWTLIILCVIFSFFFSGSETALSCCNRFKMQIKADNGSRPAKLVLKVLDKFDRALTTVLIGNNIAAILVSTLSTFIFLDLFKSAGISDFNVSLISSICMSLLLYIVGDSLPKTIAKAIPDTLSLIFIYPIYALILLFTYVIPITLLFDGFVKLIEKLFKVKDEETFTEEDFELTVDKVTDDGVIEEEQAELIQSALDFADTNVKEVLTPREKIFAIDIKGLTHEKLIEIIVDSPYSRIPIYENVFDNFIGVLHIKTYFKEYEKNHNVSIRKIIHKPYFITPKVMIDDLFNGFKKHHAHLALVRDNKKKIIGMVTMEDVLEELVPNISEPNALRKAKK